MERARFAAACALLLVLVIASVASGAAGPPDAWPLGAVTWPTSTLVVSEVMTGGTSASDEFVEIANQGSSPANLAGLELAYVTSSGSTVTRKATWTEPTILDPGRRYLVANALGAHAVVADATYSGGFAATGGAIVLRAVGGGPVDAVGWGDGTNGFVEGAAAPAPPAGSSIERRPGGIDGNGLDSNDNATDWFLQAVPSPQNVTAPPVPAVVPTPPPPTPTPTIQPTAEPTVTPEPTAPPTVDPTRTPDPSPTPGPTSTAEPTSTPEPTATLAATPSPEPTATPSAAPSSTPEPTQTPAPTPSPSPSPAPTVLPTPSPEPTPSSTPSPLPSVVVTPIGDARLLADGSAVTVEGVLTTALGALEAGRSAFVQDESGGIALYLDAAALDPLPAGTLVTASGTLDERYGARTLRVALAAIVARGPTQLPDALLVETGLAAEPYEGVRVEVVGTTVGSPSALADGTGLSVDDGSGQVRVIVAPATLGSASVPAGTPVRAVGPLGQRDSSGTGASGYRVHATNPGDFEVLEPPATPTPTPSPIPTSAPTPTPSASPAPSPTPSATPGPSPTPSAAPSPTPSQPPSGLASIASARALPVGATATIVGTVTAEAGRLGTPALLVVADDSGGIVVRLPDGAAAAARGSWLRITGKLADPYGQLELRPSSNGLAPTAGPAGAAHVAIDGGPVAETTEGRLVSIVGRVAKPPAKATSNDIQLDLETAAGTIRVLADASSRIGTDLFVAGRTYRLTGIVGQRATRKGALDGYRLWLRDPSDVSRLPEGEVATPPAATISIVDAIALDVDSEAVVQGVVTADARLLDASGRRIVIDDGTAAVEVLLPVTGPRPSVGTVLRAAGEMARAYGAPRLRAERVEALGPGSVPAPIVLVRAPSDATEWRLVRIAGTVVDVRRLGDRWTAEVAVGNARVPIVGLPGAGIASTALAEGRPATISGIVRRPYPSASDRRFGIVPRGPSDLSAAPADGHREASAARGAGGGWPSSTGAAYRPAVAPYIDVDLGQLDEHVGERVRVGGLVVAIDDAIVVIDDGTARGRVVLTGEAGAFLALLHVDDAINAIGVVAVREGGVAVVVDDPAGLLRVGALGELLPVSLAAAQPAGDHDASTAGDGARRAGLADGFALSLDGTTGAASLALALLASVAVTLLRRYRDRRALAARVARRLAGLGLAPRPPAPDGG